MPYVTYRSDGEVEGLFREPARDRDFLPLDNAKVLHFLLEEDARFAASLLDATDSCYRILLQGLIHLCGDRGLLDSPRADGEQAIRLDALIDRVEGGEPEARQSLELSDTKAVRVIEDIINLLIEKGLFAFDELPQATRQLLMVRRELRYYLADDES
ncbi:hypothetical protein [Paludibacterium paludis]|uniref:Uncharacterized protein n=1 Tax=Paludibacterium paludis TaxID=1225769 RepID=A0A918P2T5_9NEIS|nr:hypothetical protein [Paludibacterium paludis]GGY15356.1 hypothetical protein GCM10011289_18220 [Paludibacterium paludis]